MKGTTVNHAPPRNATRKVRAGKRPPRNANECCQTLPWPVCNVAASNAPGSNSATVRTTR